MKLLLWVACVVFTLAGIYAVALVSFSDEPKGRFASWDIFPHSPGDVIEFDHGTVSRLTCCGDSVWGSYSRRPDGVWIWQLIETHRYSVTADGKERPFWETPPGSVEKVRRTIHDVEVYPSPFSIKLSCKTSKTYNVVLRRRLTRYFPF
ncbi:MAG: hypothetical protein JNM99_13600 [Verrucomicrobiaceae bacterium]|nr:hypothetical protein [Verrucomicrobiaceae bacterium]